MNLNRVELAGGVVRVPELRYTPGGYPHCGFTVAVNDTKFDKDAGGQVAVTSYIACQIWGPYAVLVDEMKLRKGEKVLVLGQLDQSEWEDKEGKKQSKTRVRVATLQRLEPPEGWGTSGRQQVDSDEGLFPDDEAPF